MAREKEMSAQELEQFGKGILGMIDASTSSRSLTMPLPVGDGDPPKQKPGAKPAPVKPAVPAKEPTPEEIGLAEAKQRLEAFQFVHGAELEAAKSAKPAPDPEIQSAQALADAKKLVVAEAVKAAKAQREEKDRQRAIKSLRKLGFK